MLPETKKRVISGAINDALGGHKKVFGRYLLSGNDVVKIVTIVLKVLGTLSTPECGQCTSELINDIVG